MSAAPGSQLGPLEKRPGPIDLFRFSAATWNGHRVHFDREFARAEGRQDVVVQGYLFGSWMAQAVQDWAGPGALLLEIEFSNRHPGHVGHRFLVHGVVTAVRTGAGAEIADLELRVEDEQGQVCAPGRATVRLP